MSSLTASGVRFLLLTLIGFASVGTAKASSFHYELQEWNNSGGFCDGVISSQTDALPVEGDGSFDRADALGTGTSTLFGAADRGIVRSSVDSFASAANSSFTLSHGGCTVVRMIIDDITVSGPGGGGTAELNAEIIGELLGVQYPLPANAFVQLTAIAPGGASRSGSSNSVTLSAPGAVDTTLASGPVVFLDGDTLTAELRIAITNPVTSSPLEPGPQSATVDFATGGAMGLSFARSGPVITLTNGYTADSTDGNIVDNQWQAPSVSVPALPVGGAAFLAFALTASGARALWRHRRAQGARRERSV